MGARAKEFLRGYLVDLSNPRIPEIPTISFQIKTRLRKKERKWEGKKERKNMCTCFRTPQTWVVVAGGVMIISFPGVSWDTIGRVFSSKEKKIKKKRKE